jgi:hypothetical protein
MLVPIGRIELVLSQGDWCLLQVGVCKHHFLFGAQERRLVSPIGWFLQAL